MYEAPAEPDANPARGEGSEEWRPLADQVAALATLTMRT